MKALSFMAMVMIALGAAAPVANAGVAVMAYYEGNSSNGALKAEATTVTELATDSFDVDAKGAITGRTPQAALRLARAHGMARYATVSNFGATDFVPAIAHAIITSTAATQHFIAEATALVEDAGYTGLNIDFEAVPAKDRAAFSSFVEIVATALRSQGFTTVLSVPAELKDDPTDSWTGAFDFVALGRSADILQLMTYDENGPWGPPGPVAGLDWVTASVAYATAAAPAAKISLGLPAYGYDWNLTRHTGVQIAWKAIPALLARTRAAPRWDTGSSSPWFSYSENGARHVVWYENSASLPLKSALVASQGLAGVSVFALGMDDPSYWQAVLAGGL